MTHSSQRPPSERPVFLRTLIGVLLVAAATLPAPVEAQYFGRNKVQYDDFDFRVLETPHFNIHFYERASDVAITDFARMGERWYERLARIFQHEFEQPKPLVVYADHPDFQQTNTLQGAIGEGTGGVTESLKNRVIMPLTGSYGDTDHVLGHELVHAFQYNIAQSRRGGGIQGLSTLPLWLIEGMAEYLSVGREDPHTAMWMRDAILRDDFPTIEQLTRDRRYFPYRYGQALWAYVGGVYGDEAVIDVFRRSLRIGFPNAIQQVLGVPTDTLSVQWRESVAEAYLPLMEGRTVPSAVGTRILDNENAGNQNFAPALSPDGRYIAFLSEKDLFSVDLYIADAVTGEIVRKLVSATTDPHGDALRYIDTSGSWSPDGSHFAFVVFANGDNQIVIIETEDGDRVRRIDLSDEGLGAINNPSWSPDGTKLAFTGMDGGISDLYLYDLETEELDQLTNDRHADFHPAWSPDGSTIAFASDRGPNTDFEALTYGTFRIATLDLRTRGVRVLDLLGEVRHSNPQYGPDGSLYFISDVDGFPNVYRYDGSDGALERVTNVVTGVSGITAMSPALSVAAQSGRIAVAVFDSAGYAISTLPQNARGTPIARMAMTPEQDHDGTFGRILPPVQAVRGSRVAEYLEDAQTGLPPVGTFSAENASDYEPSLALDYIGQPSLGVGADQFGTYIGGGASAYFSDMLGNQTLGVALQAQGSLKDIGGQAFYADVGDRWNWAVGGGRIPYQYIRQGFGQTDGVGGEEGELFLAQRRYRIFNSNVLGQVSYPFSSTQRIEFGAGLQRYAYDVEEDRYFLDDFGRIIGFQRVDRDDLEPDPLNLANLSVALVGDRSFAGFVSPIRGGRYRFELEATVGTIDFLTATADWRRYWAPHRNLTVALRGIHFGRYGNVDQSNVLQPLFLGYETFIRGYAWESFENAECLQSVEEAGGGVDDGSGISNCPVFDRLFGQRIGVVNFEFRIPFLGTREFGLINFPYAPTELVLFADAGIAWDGDNSPVFEFSRSSSERVPVFSVGASARTNLLGIFILETYFAYPFQRPERGWHLGFSLAPGW